MLGILVLNWLKWLQHNDLAKMVGRSHLNVALAT